MFERYTEPARRVIFFARYEASQFGSEAIDTHHLLLGLFREDRDLMKRCVGSIGEVEKIRRQLEEQFPVRSSVSTSVDLPLSTDAQHALAYAGEEVERMGHLNVDTGHLLLGLLRAHKSVAAGILAEHGLDVAGLRGEVAFPHTGPHSTAGDLQRLARQVPDERREAAARVLAALQSSVVSIAVAGSEDAFAYSFGRPSGEPAEEQSPEEI
jgi:ATP-dependent Clp protease ATP-binding subunit ClpC